MTRPPRGRPLFTLREWVLAMFGLAILPFVLIAFGFCAIIVWICLQDVLGTTWAIFALAIVAWTFLAAVRNSLRR